MNLKQEQWEVLEKSYPSSYNFIIRCKLKNERDSIKMELEYLTKNPQTDNNGMRTIWIKDRLKELNQLEL